MTLLWLTLWPLWCALLLAPAIMMSPGGFCCGGVDPTCEHCNSGTVPDQLAVVIADVDNPSPAYYPDCCLGANGTWYLDFTGGCQWELTAISWCYDPYSGITYDNWLLTFITDGFGDTYVELTVKIGQTSDPNDWVSWRSQVVTTPLDCAALFADLVLTLYAVGSNVVDCTYTNSTATVNAV